MQGQFTGRLKEAIMSHADVSVVYKSPLHKMTQTSPTCLWNDSASISELTYSMDHGAVGATCNPVIALSVLRAEMRQWEKRIRDLISCEMVNANEEQIG